MGGARAFQVIHLPQHRPRSWKTQVQLRNVEQAAPGPSKTHTPATSAIGSAKPECFPSHSSSPKLSACPPNSPQALETSSSPVAHLPLLLAALRAPHRTLPPSVMAQCRGVGPVLPTRVPGGLSPDDRALRLRPPCAENMPGFSRSLTTYSAPCCSSRAMGRFPHGLFSGGWRQV